MLDLDAVPHCIQRASTAQAALVLVRRAERIGSSGMARTASWAPSSSIVWLQRASSAQSSAGEESPAELEGPAGSAGYRPQSGPRGTHGPCMQACLRAAQARTCCWR